jgi:hypothetical protein
MTSSAASHHLPQSTSQNLTDMYCSIPIDIANLCKIIKSTPDLMVQPFKPGSGNTIYIIRYEFEDHKLSVTATNCIGDNIKFSVEIFSPDNTVVESSQCWVIRYLEESYDRSTSFITKRNFIRCLGDKGVVLRNSRDDSIVATNSPHLASPMLLHGSGIYFPQLNKEGVGNLISTIGHPQAQDTLIRLSAQPHNHAALLAPCDDIPLLDALTTRLQPGNESTLKKVLVIIANFAACEETRTVLVGKTLLDSLVAHLSHDDPTIKSLLGVIFTYLRSSHTANLEPYTEQLQSL